MNSKKYIDVAKEADDFQPSDLTDTESHEVRHDSDRPTLRDQIIGYFNNAQKSMEAWPDWPAWPGH
jgi:hypothetical protein